MSQRSRYNKKILLLAAGLIIVAAIPAYSWYRNYQKVHAVCTDDCNVLLISVDSLRADHMSSYGYGRNTTPNFDNLAKQGTLFKNYYASSFLTPVAEASVHTGLYPTSNGITNFDNTLPVDRTTMAEYMKKLGYQTKAVISSPEFVKYPSIKASFSRGFDSYKDPNDTNSQSSTVLRRYPPIQDVKTALKADGKDNKQTFLWLALGGVHWPFGEDAKEVYTNQHYVGTYAKAELGLSLFMSIYQDKQYPSKAELRPEDKAYFVDKYDDGVRTFDDYLGQIIAQLKEQNLQNKTIIVIQSEHGEALGEQGYYAHYDVLDNQVHVPLLIVDPRIKGGKKIESLTGSVDVLPTVLNLAGTSADNDLQGKSLAPLMKGTETDGQRNEIYLERVPLWEEAILIPGQTQQRRGIYATTTDAKDIAIRTDKWKYILRLSNKREMEVSVWAKLTGMPIVIPEAELYDLANDPKETKNVVSEHPEVVSQLNKQLNDWYAKVQVNAPQNVQKSGILQPYQ